MLMDEVRRGGAEAARRALETEAARRLPDDLAAALVGTGLLRGWVPRRYGGAELGAETVLDAIEELSFHDGATGWCAMIGCTTSLTASFLDPDWAELIYGDPAA